ncbi:MAG: class I SAM-dependent methyltransferase [Dehalococcoidia bacterium]|nr:class I SAM-dependent methyltransferase [Dehalococcoidia bacterium]
MSALRVPTPWEAEAADWIAWARTAGHDVFAYYAPSFFTDIVPSPRGLTLEIGCGEGRVLRELTTRHHRAVGIDAAPTLLRAAVGADARPAHAVADAAALPFADATFGTVVAYNSLQTMAVFPDMARAVEEAARVLEPSGHLCVCVAHPMTDLGRMPPQAARAEGSAEWAYFERQRADGTVVKDGLTMTFHGWTYTLEDYARAIESAGMRIERLLEPRPSEEQVAARPGLSKWREMPLFLFVRAVKAEPGI